MHNDSTTIEGLTTAGCLLRQARLTKRLQGLDADGLLVCDRRHIYYFTGYWPDWYHAPLLLLTADGASLLALPEGVKTEGLAIDEVLPYPAHFLGTLVDDQFGAALQPMQSHLGRLKRWGTDLPHLGLLCQRDVGQAPDLATEVLRLRRAKEVDEAALIRHAIRACEAAYARAAEMLAPGVREIDLFAEMQAAAVKEAGEQLGEMGNDFQAGSPGGRPRARRVESGELMPLDVAISLRGYRCDLCRTFAVSGEATQAQQEAAELVRRTLAYAEQRIAPGASCRALYSDALQQLDGVNGWKFTHHLGHGTGLSAHEGPRLNLHWDDFFAVGDLFTVEPGLYHADLKAGVRIEENYWLSPDGLRRLSSFPTSLTPADWRDAAT